MGTIAKNVKLVRSFWFGDGSEGLTAVRHDCKSSTLPASKSACSYSRQVWLKLLFRGFTIGWRWQNSVFKLISEGRDCYVLRCLLVFRTMLHGQAYRYWLCVIMDNISFNWIYLFSFETEQNKRWVPLKLDHKILKCYQPLKRFPSSCSLANVCHLLTDSVRLLWLMSVWSSTCSP